jgi:hypothetical protein
MSKGRVALVAGVIVAALAIVFGFSSSPASARSSGSARVVLTSTSPSQPTAGQKFTMYFQLRKAGGVLHMADAACYGSVAGRAAPLLEQTTDGTTAHCTWAVPSTASGKTWDGILAGQRDSGNWLYLGYDLPIR